MRVDLRPLVRQAMAVHPKFKPKSSKEGEWNNYGKEGDGPGTVVYAPLKLPIGTADFPVWLSLIVCHYLQVPVIVCCLCK